MQNRPGKSMWEDMDTFERVYMIVSLVAIAAIAMLPVLVYGH